MFNLFLTSYFGKILQKKYFCTIKEIQIFFIFPAYWHLHVISHFKNFKKGF